jgi:hypothetical protein
VVHGRPFPLDGSYFANCFVHFEPVDEQGNRKNEGSSESLVYPPPHHDAKRMLEKEAAEAAGAVLASSSSSLSSSRLKGAPLPGEGLKYYQHHDHAADNLRHEAAHAEAAAEIRARTEAQAKAAYEAALKAEKEASEKEGKAFVGAVAREARAKARQAGKKFRARQADLGLLREEGGKQGAEERAEREAREEKIEEAWGVEGGGLEGNEAAAVAEEVEEEAASFATGSTSLHVAAARGDLAFVTKSISEGQDVLVSDANNWHPLHEVGVVCVVGKSARDFVCLDFSFFEVRNAHADMSCAHSTHVPTPPPHSFIFFSIDLSRRLAGVT